MPTVNVGGYNVKVNFPDTMSQEDIQKALRKQFPPKAPTQGQVTPAQIPREPLLGRIPKFGYLPKTPEQEAVDVRTRENTLSRAYMQGRITRQHYATEMAKTQALEPRAGPIEEAIYWIPPVAMAGLITKGLRGLGTAIIGRSLKLPGKVISKKLVGIDLAKVADPIARDAIKKAAVETSLKKGAPQVGVGVLAPEIGLVKTAEEIIKPQEIVNELSKVLDVPIRRGLFRQKALGIYKRKPQVIRLKEGGEPTAFHEVGHHLENLPELFVKNLRRYSDELIPLTAGRPKWWRTSREGFAEYMKFYLSEPDKARSAAPKFTQYFEEMLKKPEYKDIKNVLGISQQRYTAYKKLSPEQKVISKIYYGEEADLKKKGVNLYTMLIDDLNPIKKYVEVAKRQGFKVDLKNDPYLIARLTRGFGEKANKFIQQGAFNIEGKVIGPSLKEIVSPIESQKLIKEFDAYLTAKSVLERTAFRKLKGKKSIEAISVSDAKRTASSLERQYPFMKETSEKIYQYGDNLLQYARDRGVISEKSYNRMKGTYQSHVPLYRVMEELSNRGYLAKGYADITSPIKRAKGSERPYWSPLESLMKNTYAIINAADRNEVGQAMARLSSKHKDLGRLFEEVPRGIKGITIPSKEVIRKALPGSAGKELSELVGDDVINIFRPSMFKQGNVVSVLFDGKPKDFFVDPDILQSLKGLDGKTFNLITKILRPPARLLRAGATLTAEFMGRNPVRDNLSAMVYSKYGFKPGVDFISGLWSVIKRDDLYQEWLRSSGGQSMLVSMDRNYLSKNLREMLHTPVRKYLNPIEWARTISQLGESATRMGEFKLARKAGVPAREAAFASREVTLDFSRIGEQTKALNQVAAFFNANVQGIDKLARAWKEQPMKTAWKTTVGITIPSITLWALNQDNPRYYNDVQQWEKDMFWIIFPYGDTPNKPIIRIPKPFELGIIFGTIPERILEWTKNKDPEAVKGIMDLFKSQLPNPVPTAALPIIETTAGEGGYSWFRQRPIVPVSLQKVEPSEQVGDYSPEVLKAIGRKFNISPLKAEHLIRGYTAGLGKYALDIASLPFDKQYETPASLADYPFIKAFVSRGERGQVVTDFFKTYNTLLVQHNTIAKMIREDREEEASEYLNKHPESEDFDEFSKAKKSFMDYQGQIKEIMKSQIPVEEKRKQRDEILEAMKQEISLLLSAYKKSKRRR